MSYASLSFATIARTYFVAGILKNISFTQIFIKIGECQLLKISLCTLGSCLRGCYIEIFFVLSQSTMQHHQKSINVVCYSQHITVLIGNVVNVPLCVSSWLSSYACLFSFRYGGQISWNPTKVHKILATSGICLLSNCHYSL